uniref:Uncharacterized protein n=1 Tax=Anguilla anguilla TaxID=7936 RepID=A0A0E9RY01_ANGAN
MEERENKNSYGGGLLNEVFYPGKSLGNVMLRSQGNGRPGSRIDSLTKKWLFLSCVHLQRKKCVLSSPDH